MFSSRKILIPDVPPKRRASPKASWFEQLKQWLCAARGRVPAIEKVLAKSSSTPDHLIASCPENSRELRD
jgi:hypothetical protein